MTPYLSLKPNTKPFTKPTPWQMYLLMRALVDDKGVIDSLSPSSFINNGEEK